jgi:hypothetical protein
MPKSSSQDYKIFTGLTRFTQSVVKIAIGLQSRHDLKNSRTQKSLSFCVSARDFLVLCLKRGIVENFRAETWRKKSFDLNDELADNLIKTQKNMLDLPIRFTHCSFIEKECLYHHAVKKYRPANLLLGFAG